jgi:hypothetical protein
MQNTLVWQALVTFSPLERKHFRQWLQSEFFNRRTQPVLLYEYLQHCIVNKQIPSREKANQFIHKEQDRTTAFNDLAMRLLLSELLGHIETFLAYNNYFTAAENVALQAANAYRKRGLDKHFNQCLQSAYNQWEQQPNRHTEYWNANAAIAYERYQYLSVGRRTEPLNLQDVSDQTDLAYMANKLRHACFARTHQAVFKTDYQFGLLDAVIEYLSNKTELLAHPAIGLYYYCYHFLLHQDSDTYFQTFKQELLAKSQQLPEDEVRNLHLLAINYCIKRINQMDTPYMKEALDLYKSALAGNLLLEYGQLSHFAFNNIVAIALRSDETDWAAEFIKKYAEKIEKKHQTATYHLNSARVAYVQGKHDEALLHLQKADYKDLINNLIAKTLQLKIYYEMGEADALDAHLQSMQTFIRRQRIIGYHKINYLNIIKYAKKLATHNQNDKKERAKLADQISGEQYMTEREWFLSQLK